MCKVSGPMLLVLGVLTLFLAGMSCDRGAVEDKQSKQQVKNTTYSSSTEGVSKENAAANKVAAASDKKNVGVVKAGASKLANLVFIGKKKACECTKTRCQDGLVAVQGALKEAGVDVPIIELFTDVDGPAVEKYRSQKPFVMVPAVYLCNAEGVMLEMVQGDLTVSMVKQKINSVR